jgi:hypothetical protein
MSVDDVVLCILTECFVWGWWEGIFERQTWEREWRGPGGLMVGSGCVRPNPFCEFLSSGRWKIQREQIQSTTQDQKIWGQWEDHGNHQRVGQQKRILSTSTWKKTFDRGIHRSKIRPQNKDDTMIRLYTWRLNRWELWNKVGMCLVPASLLDKLWNRSDLPLWTKTKYLRW